MNRTIEAVLKLSSKLGSMAAFDRVSGRYDDVTRKVNRYNRSQSAMARGAHTASAALMRVAAPAALALGAQQSFVSHAAIERRMERIGINAGASAEETGRALDRIRRVADDTEQPVEGVVDALETLVAAGRSMPEALSELSSVAATAHATGASNIEIATTADAIAESFGIASREMQNAFDILAYGGELGKFELRDMASSLPSLAPAFAALGYEGEEGLKRLVAALQAVRMETGTSGEAATAFMDVVSKMETDTVANKFEKFGIDIREELDRARASGEDLLEAFIRLSIEAVEGDLSKLPQLFSDKQMLVGMRALINRTEDMRDVIEELGDSAGTTARNLERLADDGQATLDRLANVRKELVQEWGESIAPTVLPILEGGVEALSYDNAVVAGRQQEGKSWWDTTLNSAARIVGLDDQDQTDLYARAGGHVFDGDEDLARDHPDLYQSAPHLEELRHARGLLFGDIAVPDAPLDPRRVALPASRPGPEEGPISVPQSEWSDLPPRPTIRPPAIRAGAMARLSYPELPPQVSAPPVLPFGDLTGDADMVAQATGSADRLLDFKRAAEEAGGVLAQGADDAGGALALGGEEAGAVLAGSAAPVGQQIGDSASGALTGAAASIGAAIGQAAAAEIQTAADGAVRKLEGAAGRLARRRARGNPGRTMEDAGVAE